MSALLIASMRVIACSTSTQTSALTAVPVSQFVRWRRFYYEDDIPAEWSDYYKVNVDFFDEVGSPGGAAKVGPIAGDHPIVAALPPQLQA